MSRKDNNEGYQDAQDLNFDPPHPPSLLRDIGILPELSEDQKQDNVDYKEGYHEGKRDRNRN